MNGVRMKNFNIIGFPWKIRFWRGGSRKTNMYSGKCLKRGLGQFANLRGGAWQKRGGGVFEGGWCPNAYYDDKTFFSVYSEIPSEIFCSKICWQTSVKASFMYQQWTATVLIFLKVPTTDSQIFFLEYISRTAILTQASVIIVNRIFRFFIVLVLLV